MCRFGSFLNKVQDTLTDYCEFRSACPYFNPENFTCANGGGSHCGKYRSLNTENEPAKAKSAA